MTETNVYFSSIFIHVTRFLWRIYIHSYKRQRHKATPLSSLFALSIFLYLLWSSRKKEGIFWENNEVISTKDEKEGEGEEWVKRTSRRWKEDEEDIYHFLSETSQRKHPSSSLPNILSSSHLLLHLPLQGKEMTLVLKDRLRLWWRRENGRKFCSCMKWCMHMHNLWAEGKGNFFILFLWLLHQIQQQQQQQQHIHQKRLIKEEHSWDVLLKKKRMFLLMHQQQEGKENNGVPLGNKSITRKRNTCFFSLLKGIQRTKVAGSW